MNIMKRVFVLICLASISVVFLTGTILEVTFASTFLIQQLGDEANDLQSKGSKTNQACTRSNLPIPDIVGVAYNSNGDVLNGTIWLREKFSDPNKFIHNTNVTVYVIDVNNSTQSASLDQYISIKNGHVIPIDVGNGSVN